MTETLLNEEPCSSFSWLVIARRWSRKLDIDLRIAKLFIVNVKHSNDIEVGQVDVSTVLLSLAALTMAITAYLLG